MVFENWPSEPARAPEAEAGVAVGWPPACDAAGVQVICVPACLLRRRRPTGATALLSARGLEAPEDFGLEASGLAMVVGYLGSIELPSAGCSLESDSVHASRCPAAPAGRAERSLPLVAMQVMHDCVQHVLLDKRLRAAPPTERGWR